MFWRATARFITWCSTQRGADDKTLNQTIASTIMLLEGRGQKWINELPIERKEDGSYAFKADMESDIEYMKGPYMLNMQSYATAEDCMAYMTELYECEDIADETLRMKVIAVRYYMQKLGFSRSTPYTFAQGVDEATVAAVSEASAELPGVNVEVSTERYYENGSLAPAYCGRNLFAHARSVQCTFRRGKIQQRKYFGLYLRR